MKMRYRLMRRGSRGRTFYCVDTLTGKRVSLQTGDPDAAEQVVLARNQSLRQPSLNLNIAKAYLAGSDSGVATRTWQQAMDAMVANKQGANQKRWQNAIKDKAFNLIRRQVIMETKGEHLLTTIQSGTVSTNVFLRKLHNFCLDMNWLPWPLIAKRQWPVIRFKEKRAITLAEHQAILAREKNPERKAYYQMAWHSGASQTDLAFLQADDIDWENRTIGYLRRKTKSVAQMHFGNEVEAVLRTLPLNGPLFPYLRTVREADRSTEFKQRCMGLGITGVTLHSYRYAWAERARKCGYPERFAQEALGHNSKAVHRAYARRALVLLPSLEEYELRPEKNIIVPLRFNPPAISEPASQTSHSEGEQKTAAVS